MKLGELAALIKAKLEGDAGIEITGVATLNDAGAEQVSFFHNRKYLNELKHTRAAAVIVTAKDAPYCPCAQLIVDDPYFAYAELAGVFCYEPQATGIHPRAVVAETARLAAEVTVGANAVIGEHVKLGQGVIIGPGAVVEDYAEIGALTEIKANATIAHHVKIGQKVIVHQNAVVGSDGFGNAMHEGRWCKVPQIGAVIVGDEVEIGANTTVDRGALGNTIIEDGVRLDNLIQIGHNVKIGAHTAIAACSGIAGSTTIGKYCLFGGGVGINGHISIADGTILTAHAQVSKNITNKGVYSSGTPVVPNAVWRRNAVRAMKLDETIQKLQKSIQRGASDE